MAGAIFPVYRLAVTFQGQPASGALLYTWLSGTSTPQAVYSDSALLTPRSNPVEADANGIFPICYLAAVSYRVLVTTSDGQTIYPTQDNIYDLFQISTPQVTTLPQAVTIDSSPDYTWTFPATPASGVLAMNGSGVVSVVTDAAGVLTSNGSGTRSFTQAPTLTTPTMTIPVVSTRISLTGGQIAFPAVQVASSDANTLDDYEEFNWTPVVSGTGGGSGQTYNSQHGEGVKIGRWVFCTCTITLTAKGTITGDVIISGLPYAVDTAADSACAFGDFDATATNQVWVAGIIGAAGYILLRNKDAASTSMGTMDTSDISNTTAFEGIFYYRAAA